MPTQVQQRGAPALEQNIRTLTSRELDMDTTNLRVNLHDGLTPGGIPHVNYADLMGQVFTHENGAGVNAINVSYQRPPASYQPGQKFSFKAQSNNTGPVTIDINGLGAKSIKKKDGETSTLVNLQIDDIIAGGEYEVVYDGTDFQVLSLDKGGLVSVSQGDLNTSLGAGIIPRNSRGILPGGEYGLYPSTRTTNAASYSSDALILLNRLSGSTTTSASYIYNDPTRESDSSAPSLSYSQRYIASSPPFDLGDGEAGGFIFLKINSQGEVLQSWAADVPPWAYNGPTDIRADMKDKRGRKYRKIIKVRDESGIRNVSEIVGRSVRSLTDISAKELAMFADKDITEDYEEISQELKNRDMSIIPHPFGGVEKGEYVVMVDILDDSLRHLINIQNHGADILSLFNEGYYFVDNEAIEGRVCPAGVDQFRLKKK